MYDFHLKDIRHVVKVVLEQFRTNNNGYEYLSVSNSECVP